MAETGAMKGINARKTKRVALAFLLTAAATTPALAEDPLTPWRDETGQVSLQVSQNGWQVLEPDAASALTGYELSAVPDPNERLASARCTLNNGAGLGERWVSREHANRFVRDRLGPGLRQFDLAYPDFTVERFELTEVDGVLVVDVYGGVGTSRGLSRTFILQRDGKAANYMIGCYAEQNDVARVATAIRIAESLRIHERPEAQ
jgi:hypothetical protein